MNVLCAVNVFMNALRAMNVIIARTRAIYVLRMFLLETQKKKQTIAANHRRVPDSRWNEVANPLSIIIPE